MDVFTFRDRVVNEYESFSRSFTRIGAADIQSYIERAYEAGSFWPAPLIQLNPSFVSGGSIQDLCDSGLLDGECAQIFRSGKGRGLGTPLQLYQHQEEAIRMARQQESYVVTTGTGSGKSLTYFIPIVDAVLRRRRSGDRSKRIQAIVIYPMNALCNSQMDALEEFLQAGYQPGQEPVTFGRYTGQESQQEREKLAQQPPDLLLTNYVMLELIVTRQNETDRAVVAAAQGLNFLVLDELHTYRGRQGADVALLVRRVRERLNPHLLCIGTSATMASGGTSQERTQVVAEVSSRLFGSPVKPDRVITETLERVTGDERVALSQAIQEGIPDAPDWEVLRRHPIAAWVELNLGLEREDGKPDGKFVRLSRPKSLKEAAQQLAQEAGEEVAGCEKYLQAFLLLAHQALKPDGRPMFAFRLHQFIAAAGDLFSTLEPEDGRYLTLKEQQFQPGERTKRLFNLCFCRECGQEFYPIWASLEERLPVGIQPRELSERSHDDDSLQYGYFMPDPHYRYDPEDVERANYPAAWIELGGDDFPRLAPSYRKYKPVPLQVDTLGSAADSGLSGWYLPGLFRFCPTCGISYDGSYRNDFSKLASLSTEGRSSATTVLTLSALKHLLAEDLDERAKKLLGFTDNRQDASLQAGHFNDFIQVLLLRGALLAALQDSPSGQLKEDELPGRVQSCLRLQPGEFAQSPDKLPKVRQAGQVLRDVLGYRLYVDLRRGWRISNPNLERLNLLETDYEWLKDCCEDASSWQEVHPLLAHASPSLRERLARDLLNAMRAGLCIVTRYLDRHQEDRLSTQSFTLLKEPWGIAEDERLTENCTLIPRPQTGRERDYKYYYLSYRSAFGRQLKTRSTWDEVCQYYPEKFQEAHYNQLVDGLLAALEAWGIVEAVEVSQQVKGYHIKGDTLIWKLKIEASDAERRKENEFFRTLYETVAALLRGGERLLHQLEAREHTAQVPAEKREERESRFKEAELKVLYCSPTMELGVDIATLNTVYLRNVPPTPANYAQRSGRAGRSGQPALVITYCAARAPHDQYFFSDPTRIVAGAVNPPALDLANEDLLKSHLRSVWLAETGQHLPHAVRDLLDLAQPAAPILSDYAGQLNSPLARQRAIQRGQRILQMLKADLAGDFASWYGERWLEDVINSSYQAFEQSFDRWRSLYRATREQMERAYQIVADPLASPQERKASEQRLQEATTQNKLLLEDTATLND